MRGKKKQVTQKILDGSQSSPQAPAGPAAPPTGSAAIAVTAGAAAPTQYRGVETPMTGCDMGPPQAKQPKTAQKPHHDVMTTAAAIAALGTEGPMSGRDVGRAAAEASGVSIYCAFGRIVKLAKLKPNPQNPNTHSAEQLKLYGKIIKANGWRRAIVVSTLSGLIVKGHGAWLAAKQIGLTHGPIDFQDYPTPEAERQDMLADNELARLAMSDEAKLQEILNDLEGKGCDPELTGILQKLEDGPELKAWELIRPPPKMAWVLIGIPVVRYGDVAGLVETIGKVPEVLLESTVSND